MLDNQFYPTPVNVIEKMMSPYFYKDSGHLIIRGNILDPQAGSGNILDYIREHNQGAANLYAIEIDPNLRYILQGKEYPVLEKNFLNYHDPFRFDMIFTNPPFSEGVKHVLKAWEMLSDGGDLIGLLNSESIKNCHTQERRKLLDLLATMVSEDNPSLETLEDNGVIEWLGDCFKDSERSTNVEVVLIRLKKPKKERTAFDFGSLKLEFNNPMINGTITPEACLAHSDFIKDLVARYDACEQVLIERYESQKKLDWYLNGISQPVHGSRKASSDRLNSSGFRNPGELIELILMLKSRFWNTVFEKTELGKRSTSDFKESFQTFAIQQSSLAFTEENVKEVLMFFVINIEEMMRDCLIKIFDKAVSYHFKNKDNGWKTNKGWKLNKRIIIPNCIYVEGKYFYPSRWRESFLDDLDKVMCWLSGTKFETIVSTYRDISQICDRASQTGDYNDTISGTFFKIKIFKKGTIHLDFKDLNILDDLNRIAAEGKKWIGSDEPKT